MWERFSFYGMRSLLVLYMVDHLFLRPDVGQKVLGFILLKSSLESIFGPLTVQPLSSQIYGLYTAFVYLTPFFGGMLADRVLGQWKTVILGAVLMAIGQFLMVSENFFFVALIFLIMGNGAFKPNISTQVGGLYLEGDPRRDGAFTIFYMGINLGATLSPPQIVSMMMGIWFLSNFFGNYLSGYLGSYWERMNHVMFFMMLSLLGIGAGIAISLVSRPVHKIVAGNE